MFADDCLTVVQTTSIEKQARVLTRCTNIRSADTDGFFVCYTVTNHIANFSVR